MNSGNEGEKFVTPIFLPAIQKSITELLKNENVLSDSTEISGSEGRFLLVRFGSIKHNESVNNGFLIYPVKDNEKFVVVTNLKKD